MYHITKNHMIKICSLALGFMLIVSGVFLYTNPESDRETESDTQNGLFLLSSLCSSVEKIEESFQKITLSGESENESLSIFAEAYSAKNSFSFFSSRPENASAWFSELLDYSREGANDPQTNENYLNEILSIRAGLMRLVENFDPETWINGVNKLFDRMKTKEEYSQTLKEIENSYSLFENKIPAGNGEINEYVEDIMNSPLRPERFFGNYALPSSLSFVSANSYATVFTNGKMLGRLSVPKRLSDGKNDVLSPSEVAEKYLNMYAPYAEKMFEAFSYKTNSSVCFYFCPKEKRGKTEYCDYTENIKVVLSAKDNSLLAFDAVDYIKNHGSAEESESFSSSKIILPEYLRRYDTVSEKTVRTTKGLLFELCFAAPDGSLYYYVSADGHDAKLFGEREYMLYIGLI